MFDSSRKSQGGFSLVGALILVAVIGFAAVVISTQATNLNSQVMNQRTLGNLDGILRATSGAVLAGLPQRVKTSMASGGICSGATLSSVVSTSEVASRINWLNVVPSTGAKSGDCGDSVTSGAGEGLYKSRSRGCRCNTLSTAGKNISAETGFTLCFDLKAPKDSNVRKELGTAFLEMRVDFVSPTTDAKLACSSLGSEDWMLVVHSAIFSEVLGQKGAKEYRYIYASADRLP